MGRKKKTEKVEEAVVEIMPVETNKDLRTKERVFRLRLYRSQLINAGVADLFMAFLLDKVFHMKPKSMNVEIEGEIFIVKNLQELLDKIYSVFGILLGKEPVPQFENYTKLYSVLDMKEYANELFSYIREYYKTEKATVIIEIPNEWSKAASVNDMTGIYLLKDFFEDVIIEYY